MSRALDRLLRRGRKLLDLEVSEISIVDSPANRQVFAIVKRAKADPELTKILEAFASEDIEELMKQGDPGKLKAALKTALKTLGPYLEGMPTDVSQAIKVLGAFASGPPAAADGEDYGQPPEKKAREGEPFDSESDRAAFYKSKRKPFPDGGTLGDLMGAIVGYAKPSLAAKWAARRIQKGIDSGDIDPADFEDVVDETEGEPHGQSKVLKGQEAEGGGDDEEQVDPWPSLGGILNR